MAKLTLLFFGAIVLLGGCGENSSPEDTIPPTAPDVFPLANYLTISDSVSGPYDQGESAKNGFRIMWRRPADSDVSEWRVFYRRMAPDSPILYAGTRTANTNQYELIIRDSQIQPDSTTDSVQQFHYWLHAVDGDGNVSGASDTLTFGLLRRVDQFDVTEETSRFPNFVGRFSSSSQEPDRYCLKVYSDQSVLIWRFARIGYLSEIVIPFNSDHTALAGFLNEDGSLRSGDYTARLEMWQGQTAASVTTKSFTIP